MIVYNGDKIIVGDKIVLERTLDDGCGDYQIKEYFIAEKGIDGVYLISSNREIITVDGWELITMFADISYKVDSFPDYIDESFEKYNKFIDDFNSTPCLSFVRLDKIDEFMEWYRNNVDSN